MKRLICALTLGLGVAMIGQVAVAATTTTAAKASFVKKTKAKAKVSRKKKRVAAAVAKAKKNEDLQTDVKFDDSVLHGQYQVPEEALAKVENEKGLSDLIGVRKHFKDRLATSEEEQ